MVETNKNVLVTTIDVNKINLLKDRDHQTGLQQKNDKPNPENF